MRKVLPNLRSDRVSQRSGSGSRSDVVTQLESTWQKRLELAVSRVAPRMWASHLDAAGALREMSGRSLLSVDEALRRTPPHHDDQIAISPSARNGAPDDEAMTGAYLFVAACDGNGFIRENALIAFRKFPSALAFSAGLIRSADWVSQVSDAGVALVNDVLPRLAPSDVVRSLDLIERLRGRSRVPLDFLRTAIGPILATSAGREQLWLAVRDRGSSSELRQAAYEFLISEPIALPEVLESAVADPDPRIGLWALDRMSGLPDLEQRRRLLKVALAADHAAVRRSALRLYAVEGANDRVEVLRAALFDVSRGVRGLAAFELKRSHDEDALAAWRAAIDSTDRKRSDIAMMALCELGDQADLEHLAADIGARNARIRAAVLRGLLRVGAPGLEAVLSQSIFDSSKVVLRELSQVYRRGNVPLNASAIDEALARADDGLAPNLFSLAQLLGKWEELELLLRHAVDDHGARAESAAHRVDQWLRTESRRFTVPSSEQLRRLPPLFEAARARYPERRWRAIDHSLLAFMKR